MTKPILLDSFEASFYLGTTRRQIQRLAKAGVLPVHSRGPRGVLYFKVSDLNKTPRSLA
jgi:hypothetical protein